MRLLVFATLFGVLLDAGDALQIQCYQCEEMKHNDCSTPEYIVNCTVNVQDMCQKEVLVKPDGRASQKHPSGKEEFPFICRGKMTVWKPETPSELIRPPRITFDSFAAQMRNTLSEVLRLLWSVPHRLLRLPAVLHRQAELGVHLLLQHAALQRAQEEAARPLGGDLQPAASPPPPRLLPAAADAPVRDVDRGSRLHPTVCFL